MLASLLLLAVLFAPNQTLKWQCEPNVFTGREIIGFWLWDEAINNMCQGETWESCLDANAVWLECSVWTTTDECAPSSPPDDCLPVSVEHWICPGTHFGVSPAKYFTHMSMMDVKFYVGVKGACTVVVDGTVPITLTWPEYCEGWDGEDFMECFLNE